MYELSTVCFKIITLPINVQKHSTLILLLHLYSTDVAYNIRLTKLLTYYSLNILFKILHGYLKCV